jgi:hypothetical protein
MPLRTLAENEHRGSIPMGQPAKAYASLLLILLAISPCQQTLARAKAASKPSVSDFVFFEKVNRKALLAEPSRKIISDQIFTALQLHRQMEDLVREGRRKVLNGNADERQEIVRQISKRARKILRIFNRYFLELPGGPCWLHIPAVEQERFQFVHYLRQTDYMNRRLSSALQHYFFDPQPSKVTVSRLCNPNVSTLTLAIIRLDKLVYERAR